MFGQTSPLSPVVAFTEQIRRIRADLDELRRLWSTRQAFGAGVTTATTDASGLITVTHGLPFTPAGVVALPQDSTHAEMRTDTFTATTFQVRAANSSGAAVASTSITFQWIAFQEAT